MFPVPRPIPRFLSNTVRHCFLYALEQFSFSPLHWSENKTFFLRSVCSADGIREMIELWNKLVHYRFAAAMQKRKGGNWKNPTIFHVADVVELKNCTRWINIQCNKISFSSGFASPIVHTAHFFFLKSSSFFFNSCAVCSNTQQRHTPCQSSMHLLNSIIVITLMFIRELEEEVQQAGKSYGCTVHARHSHHYQWNGEKCWNFVCIWTLYIEMEIIQHFAFCNICFARNAVSIYSQNRVYSKVNNKFRIFDSFGISVLEHQMLSY